MNRPNLRVVGREPIAIAQLVGQQQRTRRVVCPTCHAAREITALLSTDPVELPCDTCRAETAASAAAKVASAESARREAARLRVLEQRRQALAASLECPPLFRLASLDTYQLHGTAADQQHQREILRLARGYLASWPSPSPVVVFRGAPGAGKGHITWSIVHALMQDVGISAKVVKLPDLIRDLRRGWRAGTGDGDQVLQDMRSLDLLAIDEVSTHAFYGAPVQHLYDIIDHRVEYQRPTILTTNETDEELARLLRPALWDRLQLGQMWEFGGASWRARADA